MKVKQNICHLGVRYAKQVMTRRTKDLFGTGVLSEGKTFKLVKQNCSDGHQIILENNDDRSILCVLKIFPYLR